jgi:hypothetical protein
VLFALVANRALDPCSKLAAAEWASTDVHIPGLEAMDEDHAYRAMDLLVDADAQAKVQEAVFFACADLLNLEVDLLFFAPPAPTSSAVRAPSVSWGTPRTIGPICRKSSSAWPSPARGSRSGCGAGPVTPTT